MSPPETAIPPVPTNATPGAKPLLFVIACLAGLAVLVLFFYNPGQHGFYPYCLFHKTTGLLCPGCGSLRAAHQLLHGNLLAAFKLNPLLTIALPFIGWWVIASVIRRRQRQTLPQPLTGKWLWLTICLIIIFGIVRNLRPIADLLS